MKRYDCMTQAPFDMEETPDGAWVFFDDVQAALDAAVAAERERCAELCEKFAEGIPDGADEGARMCAAMLRGPNHNISGA